MYLRTYVFYLKLYLLLSLFKVYWLKKWTQAIIIYVAHWLFCGSMLMTFAWVRCLYARDYIVLTHFTLHSTPRLLLYYFGCFFGSQSTNDHEFYCAKFLALNLHLYECVTLGLLKVKNRNWVHCQKMKVRMLKYTQASAT